MFKIDPQTKPLQSADPLQIKKANAKKRTPGCPCGGDDDDKVNLCFSGDLSLSHQFLMRAICASTIYVIDNNEVCLTLIQFVYHQSYDNHDLMTSSNASHFFPHDIIT